MALSFDHIYFLGIGGIGMSSMARYFNKNGKAVYGYDKTETDLTIQLSLEGIKISYQEDISQLPQKIDLVIWTPAIPNTNLLYQYFVSNRYPMYKRSAILGQLTSKYNNIAVAGTHGKTTTSILLSHIMAYSNISFTAFLGGIAANYQSNLICLGNDWVVEEADEYDKSFLQLHPNIAVISSLDADHLDIYGDRQHMVDSYMNFAKQIKDAGLLLMSNSIEKSEYDLFAKELNSNHKLLSYGLGEANVHSTILGNQNGWISFNYCNENNKTIENLSMRLPGNHNIQNVTAAIRIAEELKISEVQMRESLLSFKGVKRRFEWLHEGKQVLIDDYAHHPEELKAAIQAVKNCYPNRRVLGIFQPHLYSRTKDFAIEFANALDALDEIILVELYPARELPIDGISSNTILDLMENPAKAFVSKSNLIADLKNRDIDVILLLGAGDLSFMQNEIKKLLS